MCIERISLRRLRRGALAALPGVLFAGVAIHADAVEAPPGTGTGGPAPTYLVSCPDGARDAAACTVDKETYAGWRTFSAVCQVCHGGNAVGTTFAPNLLERFRTRVDHGRFRYVLENGFTGQIGVMPAWKANVSVMNNVDALYRYLRARADDKLPPGRPEKSKP